MKNRVYGKNLYIKTGALILPVLLVIALLIPLGQSSGSYLGADMGEKVSENGVFASAALTESTDSVKKSLPGDNKSSGSLFADSPLSGNAPAVSFPSGSSFSGFFESPSLNSWGSEPPVSSGNVYPTDGFASGDSGNESLIKESDPPAIPTELPSPTPSLPVAPSSVIPSDPAPSGESVPSPEPSVEEEDPSPSLPEEPKDQTIYITVYSTGKGVVEKVALEDYVLRALAAEMAASAPIEALKAQAVAIRSYVVSKAFVKYSCHHGAIACDSTQHCMAVKTEEQYKKIHISYRTVYEKAVKETEGQVLTYEGQVATTYFHWCSYNRTASALSVFGKDVPYLVSVPTSVDAEMCVQLKYTRKELLTELLGKTTCNKLMADPTLPPLGGIKETESGRVGTVTICGQTIQGEHFRDTLGFKSTNFEVGYDPKTDVYTFTVYGSGHGVGMSQSGAKVMAKEGNSYSRILSHYYVGTVLAQICQEMLPKI